MLSPRLGLQVSQKQILTPGLVQLVTVLQLNRLELKEMISQEIVANPFLDESEDGEELTPQEVQTLLEAERMAEPSDQAVMEMLSPHETEAEAAGEPAGEVAVETVEIFEPGENTPEPPKATDPFDEI